jgi:hypothetical protein
VLVEEPRGLADGEAVAHRDRELPDKRRVRRVERRALHAYAADRVRPIADHHADPVRVRRPQAVGERVDVGVDPRPDVLQIHDEHVDPREHLGGRLARFAVERVDGEPPLRIARVRRLDHVLLQIRVEAVLRPEQRRQRPVARAEQPVGRVHEARVDRRGIADERDPAAVDERAIGTIEQALETGADRHAREIIVCARPA